MIMSQLRLKNVLMLSGRGNYNAIANCNHILANVDEKKGVFSSGVYEAVKAGGYGITGILAFRCVRGFAPSYLRGANVAAIPYVEEVTNKPIAQLTVAEVIDKVIDDVEAARKLIKEVDRSGHHLIRIQRKGYETEDYIQGDGFWLYRKSHLNYTE